MYGECVANSNSMQSTVLYGTQSNVEDNVGLGLMFLDMKFSLFSLLMLAR